MSTSIPTVTLEQINSKIIKEQFFNLDGTTLTICLLTLQNGFVVTGESACASPEKFNKEIGDRIAKENAVHKIWALEGYLLKESLYLLGEVVGRLDEVVGKVVNDR